MEGVSVEQSNRNRLGGLKIRLRRGVSGGGGEVAGFGDEFGHERCALS